VTDHVTPLYRWSDVQRCSLNHSQIKLDNMIDCQVLHKHTAWVLW